MRLQKQFEIFFSGSPETETAQNSQLTPVLLFFELSWRPPISKVTIDFGYSSLNSLKVEFYKKEQ